MSDIVQSLLRSPDVVVNLTRDSIAIEGWKGLTISRQIDACADSFAFTVPWEPTSDNRERFRPFKPQVVQIEADGVRVVTGYREMLTFASGVSSRDLEIQGRGATGVLIDWSAGPPFAFSGMTFNQIAERVSFPYTVRAIPDTRPLADVSIDVGQSIWDFLRSLAEAQGLWGIPQENGSLEFRLLDSTRASVADLIEGQAPVISVSAKYDVTQRFQTYTVISQAEGTTNSQFSVQDYEMLGANVRGKQIIENEQESGNLRLAAVHARGRAAISSFEVSVVLTGWKDTQGNIWQPGDIVRLQAPGAFIERPTRFIIQRAQLSLDEQGGQTTTLDLCLPEFYDEREPKEFPWRD